MKFHHHSHIHQDIFFPCIPNDTYIKDFSIYKYDRIILHKYKYIIVSIILLALAKWLKSQGFELIENDICSLVIASNKTTKC